MMGGGEARLLADLEKLEICFAAAEHPAVFTVEESDVVNADMAGRHTKNLFLKDQAGAFWLITVPSEIRVDIKALPSILGSKRLSFAKAEAMLKILNIQPGSVSPLAAINAQPNSLTIVLDHELAAAEVVNVHPLRNTATISLSGEGIIKLLHHWGHRPCFHSIPRQI